MTSFNKRVLDMVVRVNGFPTNHPDVIKQSSPAGQLLSQVEAAYKRICEEGTSQTSRNNAVRL
jgi:hypothetical protein